MRTKKCDHIKVLSQVADLHGVVSKARGFNKELKATASRFLKLKVRPEAGRWVKVGLRQLP